MKKARLGRGLDALIPDESQKEGAASVSINELTPNSMQPRKHFDENGIRELAASIKENGIIQPLLVRRGEKGFEIVAGERRWRAAQYAGVKKIPIIIKEVTDRQALELALIENLQREDLNPIEEAAAYEQLIDEFGLTHEEISNRIGKDRSTITNQLRLLKLPDNVKQSLINGDITAGHARAILRLESPNETNNVLMSIKKAGLSVRKTENLVRKISNKQPAVQKKSDSESKDIHMEHIAEQLKRTLGTKVRVLDKGGRGKIEIEYYSREELERIIEILT